MSTIYRGREDGIIEASGKAKKELGNAGESIALCRYVDAGYKLICRNWRLGKTAEIDLIVMDPESDTLCFCEVKTRTLPPDPSEGCIAVPSDSVRSRKKMKIKYASRVFIERNSEFEEKNVRFDVAEVYNRGGSYEVSILKDAF